MGGQVENPKGRFDHKKDTQIENLKGRSRKKEIDQGQFVGKQSLTYARKGLKTSAKRLFRDRTYSLLAWNISSVHCAVFLFLFVHTPYFESINEKNHWASITRCHLLQLPSLRKCVVRFILLHDQINRIALVGFHYSYGIY